MASKKLTLFDLMRAVVILGVLLAIIVPNFIAMQNRAKEGSTKANMHVLQLAVEDYGQFNKRYPAEVGGPLLDLLPGARLSAINQFTGQRTEPRLGPAPDNAPAGSIWYTPRFDSSGAARGYVIEGFGHKGKLAFALTSDD